MQTDIRARLQQALGDAYELQHELAPGGMARLFLAVERSLDRKVVVKLLPPELASEVSIARFQREIGLTAHLQHPHILPILSAGANAGLLYYITPYVDGESLRHRMSRESRLPVRDALRLLREIADALAYAHARGVIHRDVKPENILLQGEHALLADFGVARAIDSATVDQRLTGTGMGIGTPQYMAPEQLLSGSTEPDARADIYSLGVVAYEVLSGTPPFAGRTPQEGMVAHLTGDVPEVAQLRPDVPPSASTAIGRALAFAPEERLESAADFRDALAEQTTEPQDRAHETKRATRRRLAIIGLAVVVAVGAYAAISLGRHRSLSASPADSGQEPLNAIAVLPFANLSPAADNEYFSDGMTEELITALSRVPGLRVVARTSAFAFKHKDIDLAALARQLHVSRVVEGSVRREHQRLRVSARLIDSKSGYEMWSEDYDRDLKDVFSVQDDIARAIAAAVGSKLDSTASHRALPGRLVRPSTKNLEAYDLYLRARRMREQRGESALRGAISLLATAIHKDTAFADAYAALALTYYVLPSYADISEDSIDPLILANANRALQLDPASVEGEIALSGLDDNEWKWGEAERRVRRAIDLDSSSAPAHEQYAILLRTEGRFPESIAEHHRAATLDPLSPPVAWNLAITLWNARRFDDAIRASERAIDLAPNLPNAYMALAVSLSSAGKTDSAARVVDQLRQRFPNGLTPSLAAWIYGRAGRTADGEAMLDIMRKQRMGVEVDALEMAQANVGLDRTDSAIAWIVRSVKGRESDWDADLALCGSTFDPLRGDPRFTAATTPLGLPACAVTPSGSEVAPAR